MIVNNDNTPMLKEQQDSYMLTVVYRHAIDDKIEPGVIIAIGYVMGTLEGLRRDNEELRARLAARK